MFKLIFFLAGLAVVIVFSVLNIGNASDISFGFKVLEDFPIFLIAAISFLCGAVFTLPFAFYVRLGNKKDRKKKEAAAFIPDQAPDEFTPDPE